MYRYEKNQNGEQDLVISGWENGIADSPYNGIANMRNFTTAWYPGVAYSAYRRIRVNAAPATDTFTASVMPSFLMSSAALTLNVGDAITFSTTDTLPSPLMPSTTYFVSDVTPDGPDTFNVSTVLGGGDITILDAGAGVQTFSTISMGAPSFSAQNNSDQSAPYGTVYILDKNGRVWQNTGMVDSLPYFVLLDGNTVDGSVAQGLAFYANYLFVFRGDSIDVNGDGTGAVNSSLWVNDWFTSTGVTFTSPALMGSISATLTSVWNGPSGVYNLTFTNESVSATFTNDSDQVTWDLPLLVDESDTANVNLGQTGITHMALFVAQSDILYFCNGRYIGAISTPPGRKFDIQLTTPGTSSVNYAALTLPQGLWSSWLEFLQNNLLIAAQDVVLPWDLISLFTGVPMPITENIYRMLNVSNAVIILAGLKGNIYVTNGYSISVLRKIPDYVAENAIDPMWSWGGLISHRQKFYFTAFAKDSQTGEAILNGIFGLSVNAASSSLTVDTAGSITMVNQNSNGLTNAGATGDAVLVDVNTTDRDSYYSSWYDGTAGGIDYNSTDLYGSDEPVIETDLIPIGTYAQSKTFQTIEFKLDEPMMPGDSISIYARQSLSDTYELIGTTTTAVLSDFRKVNFQKFQWVQFKITASCNTDATMSSFVRLREIRIR